MALPSLFNMRAVGTTFRPFVVSSLLSFFAVPGLAHGAQSSTIEQTSISRAISTAGASDSERQDLRTIYEASGNSPLWTIPERKQALLKILIGLQPDGIDVARLGALPGNSHPPSVQEDVLATRALLRAAHLLSADASDEAAIPGWHIRRAADAVVPMIIAAIRGGRLVELMRDLRPADISYHRLRAAYIHYQRLTDETWPTLSNSESGIIELGDERMAAIIHRLAALGDLDETQITPQVVSAGIKHFQRRHGLASDGRIGPATLAQLNVTPANRAAQIAINLEYWRHLPRGWPQRYVVVNTAAADLRVVIDGKTTFATKAIVGDADHPTPVIDATITAVTFNPPWTVPQSIAAKEMLPLLRRDSSYLARNNIEIIDRPTDPFGREIDWRRYSQRYFPFQFRQLPGANNALGLVKFEMSNRFDVYLHDTPDRSLFQRTSRALSHGCVRVQCAQELAEHLIDDPSIWVTTDFLGALREGRTFRVPLNRPLPVYLLYFTAFVAEDGTLNFRPDVYGRDVAARRLLSAPYPTPMSNASDSKGS